MSVSEETPAYPTPLPPTLGGLRLGSVLGKGGMGIVHEAEGPEGVVAVKVLSPALAHDDSSRARFLREGRLALKARHANVVRVHRVGEEGGTVYLVMERLRGESLSALLRREGPQSAGRVIGWARQVAAGLAAAHAAGMVHRDIKPSNIWIDESGTVKLLDFGLARGTDPDATRLTTTGAVVGTPSYMAPEQARGEPADARTDLFSLGSVLYHCLTGKPPFEAKDAVSTMVRIAAVTRPPDVFGVPPALAGVLGRLLQPDPARRFASANELLAALDAPEGGPTRELPAARPHRWPWAALLCVAVVALGWMLWPRPKPDPAPIPKSPDDGTPPVAWKPPPPNGFDLMRRGDIDETQLAIAGAGEAGKAPVEIVAILGDGRFGMWDELADAHVMGPVLTTLSRRGAAYTWALNTGRLMRHSPPPREWAGLVRLRPLWTQVILSDTVDGKEAARSVGIFEIHGKQDDRIRLDRPYSVLEFSGDGSRCLAALRGGAGKLFVVDFATGKAVREFPHGALLPTESVFGPPTRRMSGDGKRLLLHEKGKATVHDVDSGEELAAVPGDFTSALLSPDGKHLLLQRAGKGGGAELWVPGEKRVRWILPFDGVGAFFHHDGKRLFLGGRGGAPTRVVNLATGNVLKKVTLTLTGDQGRLVSLDGKLFGMAALGVQRSVTEIETGKELLAAAMWRAYPSPAGDWVAMHAAGRGQFELLSLPGLALRARPGHAPLAATTDGKLILTREAVVESANGRERAKVPMPPTSAWWLSPDGGTVKWLDRVEGGLELHNFDTASGRQGHAVDVKCGPLSSARYSPDGRRLAVLESGKALLLFDTGTGRREWLFGKVRVGETVFGEPRFSPDGKRIALPSTRFPKGGLPAAVAMLFDEEGRLAREIQAGPGKLFSVAWSPDGKSLAGYGSDGVIRVWPAEGGKPREIRLFPGPVRAGTVEFTGDGRHLLANNPNGTAYVLRLSSP